MSPIPLFHRLLARIKRSTLWEAARRDPHRAAHLAHATVHGIGACVTAASEPKHAAILAASALVALAASWFPGGHPPA